MAVRISPLESPCLDILEEIRSQDFAISRWIHLIYGMIAHSNCCRYSCFRPMILVSKPGLEKGFCALVKGNKYSVDGQCCLKLVLLSEIYMISSIGITDHFNSAVWLETMDSSDFFSITLHKIFVPIRFNSETSHSLSANVCSENCKFIQFK